ncbi:hypothetical protein BC792_12529 [Sphingobacterium allocomposti]|uniref:Uncharacterized protein n=1 Tax=Sphingobacterium allocomposti TaxID=415956 RepID=A0A5S5D5V2_9SPHI|nr:hypothetical protein BC792_12529 [Sphingobacterium composti Yoo et al. 2007 non Ten et al. 2007]
MILYKLSNSMPYQLRRPSCSPIGISLGKETPLVQLLDIFLSNSLGTAVLF